MAEMPPGFSIGRMLNQRPPHYNHAMGDFAQPDDDISPAPTEDLAGYTPLDFVPPLDEAAAVGAEGDDAFDTEPIVEEPRHGRPADAGGA